MTTSVPRVVPIEELKWQVAEALRLSMEAYCATGDMRALEMGVPIVRLLYESELKPLANEGKLDRGYLEAVRRRLEKVERMLADRKARTTC